jgi:ER-Golgi trafficking TRAPP I complex 85 kDa subunit
MLMSGHMFRSAEQEHHAFRCFTSALHIYKDSKWEELHNHLRSALAAQLYAMNRMALSLQLYAKLVGSTEGGRVSAKSQQKFVNHLLEICNEHPKKALVGADRMAASAKLSKELRESVRKDRLERIVQVVRYTKSASRVLELPNISLPGVDDSSIAVLADQTEAKHDSWIPSLGDVQRGSDSFWDELQLMATAELKVFEGRTKATEEEIPSATLAKIEDAEVRKVVAQIDREKAARVVQERAKKREGHKPDLPVRAQMEPLVVEFAITNPLGIPIDLADMQLVARMTEEDSNRTCTNEDAIKITPFVSYDQKQKWSFLGSSVNFEVPEFCRVATSGPDSLKQSWKAAEEVEPFFVLTKQSISLEPESRRTISASICPLARGTLEIVGIRSRLLDDVWVYHPFDLKGPLLQNTRANRANRVRAEPTLLKAKVERGMPCLKAELIQAAYAGADDQGPVLQGQVSPWILRLTNVGTAPAVNIFLKTNLPWLCVDTEDDQAPEGAHETAHRSCCIGPSGTLFQIPIDTVLKGKSFIEKGESIDVPIRIRATGAGHQEFYLLFRYELFENMMNSSPRYRWLRKMVAVPVYPSIALSASVASSASPLDNHILSLEIANDRNDRPDHIGLLLDKVTLLSRSYSLEPLPGQFAGCHARLGWQERAAVHFRVVPIETSTEAIRLSHCVFENTQKAVPSLGPSTSALAFACLDRAYEAFEHVLRSHDKALARAAASSGQEQDHPRSISQIRRANTSVMSFSSSSSGKGQRSHATSLARLCPVDRVDESASLIVYWNDEKTKAFGEHYIRDLEIRPPSKTKECPICVTAQHPQTCSMQQCDAPVQVPVMITLRNRMARDSVDFLFSVDHSDCFDYIGTQCFQSALSAGEEISLALQALIPSPGVYDLQRIRIAVEGEEPYVFPMQWLVSVDSPKVAGPVSVDRIEV